MRFAALLFGLVFFLQTLDLMSQATEVLKGGGPPITSLLRYVALRLPTLIETVAQLAGLLGALTAHAGGGRRVVRRVSLRCERSGRICVARPTARD